MLRMEGFKTFAFIISLLAFGGQVSYGLSLSCKTIYEQGGVFAVVKSPECSHWLLSNRSQSMSCQFATIKGAFGEEDGISCNLDMEIPFTGKNGTKYVKVGVVGLFDSRHGNEASDMASKLLLDYFLAHSMYLSSKVPSVYDQEKVTYYETPSGEDRSLKTNLNSSSHAFGEPLVIEEKTAYLQILKDALLRTIHDIESTFLKEAYIKNKLSVGTTATVAVFAEGQILVASIGNSKAFLCSESMSSHNSIEGTLLAKEITQNHYPTNKDGSLLVDADGRINVSYWTFMDRVISTGKTRAIGHFDFKIMGHYSLTTDPEVIDWQPITATDTYLILQSREVSQRLTPQDVCNLLPSQRSTGPQVQCRVEESLAVCIAFLAVDKKRITPPCHPEDYPYEFPNPCDSIDELYQGKGKDMSVIVVPLASSGFLHNQSSNMKFI